MNADLKEAFFRIKPVCDVVMVCPSPDSISAFMARVAEMKKEAVQELQQYILFPFITHIKSKEIEKKHELLSRMVDAMRVVLDGVTVNSYEMCMKIETGLLAIVFDHSKPGMIAEIPEELKLSIMRCMTVLLLHSEVGFKLKMLKTQVPLLAQAIFVSVHIAKLEKLRALRLAALECLNAHTSTHSLMWVGQAGQSALQLAAVELLASILPGVLAALQDVTISENPGHAVVVASLDSIHRILCLTMNDKHMPKKKQLTTEDFAKIMKQKATLKDKEVSNKEVNPADIKQRSPEWYKMAGEKLVLVVRSVSSVRTHEHWKVRRELAVMCYRILHECNATMQHSIPLVLDILLSLSKDDYKEVSEYCTEAIDDYFSTAPEERRNETLDRLCENFLITLNSLPRILNNIDDNRKLSALSLLQGYIRVLCSPPPRLPAALSLHSNMHTCCHALLEAAALAPLATFATCSNRDVSSPAPTSSPWCRLRHLDGTGAAALHHILALLAHSECADLILDRLIDTFQQSRDCESVYIMNWMGSAPNSPHGVITRILAAYLDEAVWYSPLEVATEDNVEGTLDVSVYNPRAWHRESVPDLYEGTVETRYTDMSLSSPASPRGPPLPPAAAQINLVLSCLLTEGVGMLARRLGEGYQPYLLKTLCLLLERVGSKYEMLHLAGLKAINDVATACGHSSVAELIQHNADYFTHTITMRLKKAWNSESALQILSVVMEYSDASLLHCLYGIVEDVLVQSCDKYHERNLEAYLKVFFTFVECIQKWFPKPPSQTKETSNPYKMSVLKDLEEYVNNLEESERLLSQEEWEESAGKSAEEMYREDLKKKEEDLLDYDDRVTEEKLPPPQHITVTITILIRCIHFITSRQRDEAILAMQVLSKGLPLISSYEDELLPLVHQTWAPLVARFDSEPVVLRRAFDLLVVMADLSKDFIRNRCVKEVLPHMYKFLHTSAANSHLKDKGSSYRNSQAYRLQEAALTAMPNLTVDLKLNGDELDKAMSCVDVYLTNKQPRPLQELAVNFFKVILEYDYGASWHHLRNLCNNEILLTPPKTEFITLELVIGTPYESHNKEYENNINIIFNKLENH